MRAAVDDGFFVREIADAASDFQRELERNERVVVGVNEFTGDEALDIPLLRVDQEGERRHLQRLNRVRRERDAEAAAVALRRLRAAASGDANLMPHILEAVRAYATLGEMMGVLRDEWGEYQPTWY